MQRQSQRPLPTTYVTKPAGRSRLAVWSPGASSIFVALALLVVFAILLGVAGNAAATSAVLQTEPADDACAPPVMSVRNAAVNVREGPDPNYPIMLVLRAGEVLPLVGRHHGFRWWAVELPDGQIGWVWDGGVVVAGNIGSVTLMPAPPLSGIVPDTTENWVPVVAEPCLEPVEAEPGEAVTNTVPMVVTATPEAAETSVTELERWTEPENLSRSGGARSPVLIVDVAQTMHVLWEDAFNGFTYTRRDGETWTAPVTVTVPFSETAPHLFADADGQIQALWFDEDGVLQQSRATAAMIAEPDAWQEPVSLAEGAILVDTAVDGEGQIHLAYLRAEGTTEQPAGIYYLRSADGGVSWSEAELLDASSYLRGVEVAESNLQIVAESDDEATHVYVAWDNRPRKRIFMARSSNGGESWETPQELVSPESTSSIILPFGARISADGPNVVLVWQYGQPAAQCQRYARTSADYGESWSEPIRLADLNPGFPSCASNNQLYTGDGLFYLLTVLENELFMQAWDGEQWSTPQRQAELSGFNDPDTLNTVTLGCHQVALFDGSSMAMLACGTGSAFNDVWFATRSLGTVETWFPPPSAWSDVSAIDAGAAAYRSLYVLGDSEGNVHALWSAQPEDGWEIYYSRLDGERWLPPAHLFTGSASADGSLAAAITAGDRLFAVWRDEEGALLFSQAAADDAAIATDWAPPATIPAPLNLAGDLALAATGSNTLFAAYTMPINEGRGLYVLRSDDQGATWSEPVLVLDAGALGWDIAGAPQLAVTGNGSLHVLITEEKLNPAENVYAERLYYVRCSSALDACSEPAQVGQEQPFWQAIVSNGSQTVHRLWQEQDGGNLRLRHQVSLDDGESWSEPVLVTTVVAGNGAPAMVAADLAGGLHLLQVGDGLLSSWLWDGSWSQGEPVAAVTDGLLQGVVTSNGTVAVLFTREGQTPGDDEVAPPHELAGVRRQVELGEIELQPAPTPTAALATPTVTPAASPTPTAVVVATLGGGISQEVPPAAPAAENPITGIGLGIIPAVLLVVGAVVLGARSVWRRR